MLILLPPSETKRDGGTPGRSLRLDALSFPELTAKRRAALAGLRRASRSRAEAKRAFGLGANQLFELERNRSIWSSPVMPAIERYTGVLYEGLGVETMARDARGFVGASVAIQSALLGLVRADDPIPAYRFSSNSRIPGLSIGAHWRDAVSPIIAAHDGLILDLRSEHYAALGPAPSSGQSVFLRVVTDAADGVTRALNHFNKKGKGEFVRSLAVSGRDVDSVAELLDWADGIGIRLRPGEAGEINLVV